MKDQNAQSLLAHVMGWDDEETVSKFVPILQLLADYKYDQYQRFGPGKRFIESLALWLRQFDFVDRKAAFDLVMDRLIYFSDTELSHLVQHAYPDIIVQERLRLVAEEHDIPTHRVGLIANSPRFAELRIKSLYLGLSDGARTNELRRASNGEISNEQIWQAYELGDSKAEDMLDELRISLSRDEIKIESLSNSDFWQLLETQGREVADKALTDLRVPVAVPNSTPPKFNLIWLLDDFSGSGNTYIRFDTKQQRYKGKIKKIYERLHQGDLIDPSHYEVYLLLYVATRQAVDHIEYWSERFTSENGFKPLQVRVLCTIERDVAITNSSNNEWKSILENPKYYDERASDKHIKVGGTEHANLGFARCALPVVLPHNTPNNSVYILWGPESHRFSGLFPRVSRHREF
jgi:hypothetical protein